MLSRLPNPVRIAAKVAAVVVLATIVGAGLGFGLSEVRGGTGTPLPAISPGRTAAEPEDVGTDTPANVTSAPSDGLRATIASSTIRLATSASGRSRQRARVRIRLRVTNDGDRAGTLGSATLAAGGEEADVDPNAAGPAGALREPIAPGDSASGELRFETAGALTQALDDTRRGELRVAGATLPVRLPDGATGG